MHDAPQPAITTVSLQCQTLQCPAESSGVPQTAPTRVAGARELKTSPYPSPVGRILSSSGSELETLTKSQSLCELMNQTRYSVTRRHFPLIGESPKAQKPHLGRSPAKSAGLPAKPGQVLTDFFQAGLVATGAPWWCLSRLTREPAPARKEDTALLGILSV